MSLIALTGRVRTVFLAAFAARVVASLVNGFIPRSGRPPFDDELGESREHEHPGLPQFIVSDVRQGVEHGLPCRTAGSSPTGCATIGRRAFFVSFFYLGLAICDPLRDVAATE